MSRSIKKGPFVAPELIKRVEEMNKTGEKKVLKTWSRSSTIFPAFVGHTIESPQTTCAPSSSRVSARFSRMSFTASVRQIGRAHV